jgi:hypothetical protein
MSFIYSNLNSGGGGGGGGGTPGGSSGQLQYNNSGSFGGVPAINGDGTLNTSTGALAVLSSAGVAFGSAAFQASSAFDVAGAAAAITKSSLGLSSVTNDVQTKAAIVPNTVPTAGQFLIGNAGGTAYVPNSISGDATISATGVIAVTKTGGVVFGSLATQSGTFSGASSGTNTGDQTITLTGEATGTGPGSFAVTLSNSAVIGKALTGFTAGAGAVSATDSILAAIQKIVGNANTLGSLATLNAAPAGTLTGTTINATVVTSSLTSLGTIATGVWQGTPIGASYGGAGTINGLLKANGSGVVSLASSGTDYQVPITLTTTGSSGAATFSAGTLNIPQYSGGSSYTFSTGLTNTSGTVTVNASQAITTLTAAVAMSANGASGTPSVTLSGTVFTGTTTTAVPYFNYQHTGTTGTAVWNANGTIYGANADSGFTGNFIDFHVNGGGSLFKVDATGSLTVGTSNLNQIYAGNVQATSVISTTYNQPISQATLIISGTQYRAGTGATTLPQFHITNGTAATTWSPTGTCIGLNPATGFTGNFFDCHLAGGGSLFAIDYRGGLTLAGRIVDRVVTAADATSVTPNSDNADTTYQLNTQSIGTLTINADGGTPIECQDWWFKIKSTNVQTFSWNAVFVGTTDVSLPTTTSGSGKIDRFEFRYDIVNSKWVCVRSVKGQ